MKISKLKSTKIYTVLYTKNSQLVSRGLSQKHKQSNMLNRIKLNSNLIRKITNCAYNFNKAQVVSSPDINEVNNGVKFKKLKLNDKELSETILTIKSKKRKQKDQKIIVFIYFPSLIFKQFF